MFNFTIGLILFFLLTFTTFVKVNLPFITFFIKDLPHNAIIEYQSNYLTFGYIEGNFQLAIIILAALFLNSRLVITFMFLYIAIGLYGLPIFYSGGGLEYLNHPSSGYILSFLPVSLIMSLFISRDKNSKRSIFNTRYTFFISLMGFISIHIIGISVIYLKLGEKTGLWNLIKAYFILPFFSQILLLIIACIFASILTTIKNKLQRIDRKLERRIVLSTKRRGIANKPS